MKNEMLKLSALGQGADLIGKKLELHGTTVMAHLKVLLGEELYHSRHNKDKFNKYWSGKTYHNEFGETFQSSYEEKVAKYLKENHILYSMHVRLLLDSKTYYPDFYLPQYDMYIEVFGMTTLKFYSEKMIHKINDYNKHKINFISITEKDFTGKNKYKFQQIIQERVLMYES